MSGDSLDGLEQVVEIADRFESAWRQGLRPRIEDFLDAAPRSEEGSSLGSTMPAVPGYQIVRLLGSGGFSEVWLAEDLNLFQRPVALKMIKHRTAPEKRRSALGALRNEAGLLVRVRHPNLVQVLGWLESEADPVLVLQY